MVTTYATVYINLYHFLHRILSPDFCDAVLQYDSFFSDQSAVLHLSSSLRIAHGYHAAAEVRIRRQEKADDSPGHSTSSAAVRI